MKNTRDVSQIDTLGRQLKISKALNEAYKDATKNAFGFQTNNVERIYVENAYKS